MATRIGLVGCGQIHAEHARRLATLPSVQVIGHADTHGPRAGAAAARFGGKAYTTVEALCTEGKPDAVFVCVPPEARSPIDETVIAAGAHLFAETPLALEATAPKATARALRTLGLLGAAGHAWRYLDTAQKAREALKGQCLSLVRGWWHGPLPTAPWACDTAASGGHLFEQATPVLDLLRFLCGEVREVNAVGSRGCLPERPGYTLHDSTAVSLALKCGAVGVISGTCVNGCPPRSGLEVITPERIVRLDNGTLTVCEPGRETVYTPQVDPLTEQATAFIEAIETGKKTRIRAPYADAIKTLQVGIAVNAAIASGIPTRP